MNQINFIFQVKVREPEQAPRVLPAGGQRDGGQVRRRDRAQAEAREVHLHAEALGQLLHTARLGR